MKIKALLVAALCGLLPATQAATPTATPNDGSVLPFPPIPSASIAAPTLAESKMVRRAEPNHLPADAPNILIILLDDVGFGLADTYGGPIHTPTLSRIANAGISYNAFHTTAICSPTRAALLTGRNHQRVGSGTIAERAVDWDGYTGEIPRTSATLAKVLGDYGYATAAFGKWHNTPATQTTAMGPFTLWPTGPGIGFDYFYGFLAGETSQWEPRLVENFNTIEPPHDERYHLSEDLADQAIKWLRKHRAFSPDKPFFMYWAPGAGHGPHHIFKEWADKYKGQFDNGWDALRERTFARQQALGWIPADTQLTPRADNMAGWDSIPESERPFQRRLMEVFAGFVEHVDTQAGKVIDELDRLGVRDNTIVFYVFGDNGSSAEGQQGSISELLAQNQIPNTVAQQLAALDQLGGLDALGGPKVDNIYHAGWAWAGDTPFQYTKLIASHFGGTRNPLAVSWPAHIKPDQTPRPQFHHVNDIAPTLYDILHIQPPKVVDGFPQDPIDGTSMAYTFADPKAPGRKLTQYFDNNGSRGIYRDGWYACTFGPLTPWLTVSPGLATWDSNQDIWELYNLKADFSQAANLAAQEPQRLGAMKTLFLNDAKENKVFPIGAGIWLRIHPEDRIKTPYTSWQFDATTTRMPEFTAPGLGRESNHVAIDAELGENASGVLYALGGASGGLTLYMDQGILIYEYNMMIIERYTARSQNKLPAGKHRIEVDTAIAKPGAPAQVVLSVDGQELARTTVKRTVPAAFTASETFDVGTDLGSPVSLDYFDRRPFAFDGTIDSVKVALKSPE
ncbi:sulfatase-like hydrolase/transferase [uncultured Thiodictyon sp.]|uniref:sulfatase-like hydrolase/transferase n=1 Tax=uncultured Thiodictyon sp. TaxID=1846217 RepID=UPI0025E0507A|nr:sulfatase-like hydrolase/transferase [uncultured Thiodictyon sp.]